MNNRLAILFASFCILVLLGACQKRYGHVKKVKVGEKITWKQKPPRHSNPAQQHYFTLENKKPSVAVPPAPDPFLVDIIPSAPLQQPKQSQRSHHLRKQNTIAENDTPPATPENFYAPHPDIQDVKLNSSNFNEVTNISLIISLVALLLLLLFLLVGFVASSITATGFLAGAASGDIVLAGLGAILIYPIIWLIKRLYKDLSNDRMTYAGEKYPLKNLKNMPGQIQLKRAWHNFIASILLTALGSVLFLFGFIFLPGVVWCLFKLIYTIFFVERY